ncbi:MAG: DNA-processing protein DprA [Proteobacteria bacterium]|nr:DNA-processing protein DprA [Pseudomonadota bacterium]
MQLPFDSPSPPRGGVSDLADSESQALFALPLDPRDERPAARAVLRAWLALQLRAALHPQSARSLLVRALDPVAALAARTGETPEQVLGARAFAHVVAQLVRAQVRMVPFGSPAYPERIAALVDAAPLLGVRGDPSLLAVPFVAIVGARAPTRLGLDIARRLARELAEHGIGIVSGLARGIDAAAHRGALEAGGITVAILGCGPEQVYPHEHAALAAEIAARGVVASELPTGAPPAKSHFPLRNRLISGLARAVVVVEARVKSGSLVTARHAAAQGRDVLAVPGSVGAPTSEGPNQLLRDGAWPVLDVSDVLAALGFGPATPVEKAGQRIGEARDVRVNAASTHSASRVRIDPATNAVLDAIRHDPATRDEIAARLGLSPQALAQQLLPLELEGIVAEDRDGLIHVLRMR